MDQATGNPLPGINIQPVNSNIPAKNDVDIIVNNPEATLIRLKTLLNPVTRAGYNSYEGQRSQCCPGTRVQVLYDIEAWVKGEYQASPIFVLDGVAALGKSTIAQTIAIRAAALGLLGASFFFSRDEDFRSVARHFFPTIAYQLACFDSAFAAHLSQSLDQNSDASAKPLDQQLTLLLLEPLQKVLSQRGKPILIVVDAFDECEEIGAEELLVLLTRHVPRINGLKILITSRPYPYVREILDQDGNHERFCLHEIDESIVQSDIRQYLQFNLSAEEIRKVPRHRKTTWQPTDSDMEILCGICRDSYIIAVTVTRFILGSEFTPQKQLSRLLYGVSPSEFVSSKHDKALDHLYTVILCAGPPRFIEADKESLGDFCRVLGALITLADPLPYQNLAMLLGMDSGSQLIYGLHYLVSPNSGIFRIPKNSFTDFITDKERIQQSLNACKLAFPGRSSIFPGLSSLLWVDMPDQHRLLAKACLRTMDRCLKRNMADMNREDMYKDKEDVPHIKPELVPRELAYAAMRWTLHLRSAQGWNDDLELRAYLERWASCHILSWMETMVILDQVDGIYGMLQDAIEILPHYTTDKSWTEQERVLDLLSDACKFVKQGSEIMKMSPMHIYQSCLPFVPIDTLLYEVYGTMSEFQEKE